MDTLARMCAETLSFQLLYGDVTDCADPHSTGWRVLPELVVSYLESGRNRMDFADGRRFDVPSGAVMLIPAGIRHRVDLTSASSRSHWFHGRFTVLGSLDLFSLVEAPALLPPSPITRRIGAIIGAWARRPASGLDSGAPAQAIGRAAAARAMAMTVLDCLAPLLAIRRPERLLQLTSLQTVLERLESRPTDPWSRDGLARLAGMSPRTFHRAFLLATGTTPIGHVRRMRLRQAQRLLITGDDSVAAIARACGYDDPFTFTRFFTRACGQNPSAYRLAHRV